jgi:hypothetical protein
MLRRSRAAAAVGLVPLLVLAAGCGSAAPAQTGQAAAAGQRTLPLDTSVVGPGESYSILEMGGSAASEDNFWQLFVRPAGASQWRLATPLGVADNGGLVAAATGAGSLLAGFRPSQDLTFSPLAATADNGTSWSADAPLPAGLADEPGALTADAAGHLLALTTAGTVLLSDGLPSDGAQSKWTTLTTERELAASAAGPACGLTGLTAVAFRADGSPLVAGSCRRAGEAGIFSQVAGGWRLAGPPLTAASHGGSAVLALATAGPVTDGPVTKDAVAKDAVTKGTGATGTVTTALIRSGPAAAGRLIVAWQGAAGRWSTSAGLIVGSATVMSASAWPGGVIGVVFTGARAAVVTGQGGQWEPLSGMPANIATLAVEPGGQVEALAASGGTFRAWTFASGSWHLAQTIRVPIPYGSSS